MLDDKKQAVLELFLEHARPQDNGPAASPAPVTLNIHIQSGNADRNGTNTIHVGPLILHWPQLDD